MFLMFSFSGGLRGWGLQVPQKTSTWIFITRHKKCIIIMFSNQFFHCQPLRIFSMVTWPNQKILSHFNVAKRISSGPTRLHTKSLILCSKQFLRVFDLNLSQSKGRTMRYTFTWKQNYWPSDTVSCSTWRLPLCKVHTQTHKKSDYKNWKLLMWNFSMVKWNCA